jgi:hypothetical protein
MDLKDLLNTKPEDRVKKTLTLKLRVNAYRALSAIAQDTGYSVQEVALTLLLEGLKNYHRAKK